MAIFTNKFDRETVPLLVQLAQIDTGSEAEVNHAIKLLLAGGTDNPEFAQEMIEACEIVRRSLLMLAIDSAMPADCIVWMENYRRKDSPTWDIDTKAGDDNDTIFLKGQDAVPVASLVKKVHNNPQIVNFDTIAITVAKELEQVVRAVWAESRLAETLYPVVSLCPECKNPMLYPNSKRIYCSRRCADRVGQRRRRESNRSHSVYK